MIDYDLNREALSTAEKLFFSSLVYTNKQEFGENASKTFQKENNQHFLK